MPEAAGPSGKSRTTGNVIATFDEVVARRKLRAYEFEVKKVSATNGSFWISDSCSGDSVEKTIIAYVRIPLFKIQGPYRPRLAENTGAACRGYRPQTICRAERAVYSLMCVTETGTELVGDKEAPYFIGALLDGDEPQSGELLDSYGVPTCSIRRVAGHCT